MPRSHGSQAEEPGLKPTKASLRQTSMLRSSQPFPASSSRPGAPHGMRSVLSGPRGPPPPTRAHGPCPLGWHQLLQHCCPRTSPARPWAVGNDCSREPFCPEPTGRCCTTLPARGRGLCSRKAAAKEDPASHSPPSAREGPRQRGRGGEGGQGNEALSSQGARSFPCTLGLLVDPSDHEESGSEGRLQRGT